MGQTATLHTHRVPWAVSHHDNVPWSFKVEVVIGRMAFLSPTNSIKALKAEQKNTTETTK